MSFVKMNFAGFWFAVCVASICLLSKHAFAAYVSDLKPDVDCQKLMIEKLNERFKNPELVRMNLKPMCSCEKNLKIVVYLGQPSHHSQPNGLQKGDFNF